jgi:hypothetical protein
MCVEEVFPMGDNPSQADPVPEDLGVAPDPESVATRAAGRPREEASSDDPMAQAQAILEESEERMAEGAKDSKPDSE